VNLKCIAAAELWLRDNTRIAPERACVLAGLTPGLLDALPADRPALIGIGGPPGTGKSTLAGMLCAALESTGNSGLVLSLDDYYLPRARRDLLAVTQHPLFAVRGVPGTHDTALLLEHLSRLKTGRHSGLSLPRFDKSTDDSLRATTGLDKSPPEVVFLEGWVIGAQPQSPGELAEAINCLERERDSNRDWRIAVNDALTVLYDGLQNLLNQCWYLRPPGWDAVVAWRWQQEQELPVPRLVSLVETKTFLAHFERLVRHMQSDCVNFADRIIDLDENHTPTLRTSS
jgi:D-glycerate 3-kinase